MSMGNNMGNNMGFMNDRTEQTVGGGEVKAASEAGLFRGLYG